MSVQGLPIPLLITYLLISSHLSLTPLIGQILLGLNSFLVLIRFALCAAIAPSYDRRKALGAWLFWLSPLADPFAFFRILISALNKPKKWRGRSYQ